MFNKRKIIGEIRLKGRADADGVTFQAYQDANGQINCSFDAYKATLGKEGEISINPIKGNIHYSSIASKISEKTMKVCRNACIACFILMVLSLISIFIPFINHYVFLIPLILVVAFMMLADGFIILFAKIRGDEEIKTYLKFLAAMNSCRNAYYKLDTMPTIKDAKMHLSISRESPYLKRAFLITFIAYVIAMEMVPNLYGTIIALCILVISFWFESRGIWQYMIYSKPEDIHYQVALSALDYCLEEQYKDSIVSIFLEDACVGCYRYDACKSVVDEKKK